MDWFRQLRFRLSRLLNLPAAYEDLAEETRSHIEIETHENIARGMSPEEARRVARLKFGSLVTAREQSREAWGFRWLEELGQDLRFAFRSFRKNPGSTAAAVVTLALGLGIGTAVFSVVNALLFKPLQYKDPDRLVMVWSVNLQEGVDVERARRLGRSMSTPEFEDWEESGIFESMVAFGGGNYLEIHPEPQAIWGFAVSPGFFETTGIQPFLGRGFLPEEERKGGRNNVLVITYEYWRRRFREDPGVIGQELVVEGRKEPEPAKIIGVLPRGFSFYYRSEGRDYAPILGGQRPRLQSAQSTGQAEGWSQFAASTSES